MVLESNTASVEGKGVVDLYPVSSGLEHLREDQDFDVTGEVSLNLGGGRVDPLTRAPVRVLELGQLMGQRTCGVCACEWDLFGV